MPSSASTVGPTQHSMPTSPPVRPVRHTGRRSVPGRRPERLDSAVDDVSVTACHPTTPAGGPPRAAGGGGWPPPSTTSRPPPPPQPPRRAVGQSVLSALPLALRLALDPPHRSRTPHRL